MRPLYLRLGLILLGACSGAGGAVAERATAAPTVLTIEQEKNFANTAGSEFRECAVACPFMVIIAVGKSTMGSPEDDPGRTKGEHSRYEMTIAKPFAVSKYEVTFDQWDACVAAAACPRVMDAWGRGNMPVINVSWGDAKQYVAWLSRLTGKEYRLLTEAEWEYAARAGTKTRYSWGDECPEWATPTAADAAALGHCKPRQLDRFGRMPLAYMTWKGTSGNGSTTFGTIVTRARRPMPRPSFRAAIQPIGSFEEDPGTMRPSSSARPSDLSVTARFSLTHSDLESGGPWRLNDWAPQHGWGAP